jgi:hypothetical protein
MSGELNLHYWPGRGLMEIPRMCLAIAGKTNGAGMTDTRHSAPEGFDFAANMGRMPVVQCDAGSVGQSLAINFFVASECGLMGSSTFEAAKILEVAEHVSEIRKVNTLLSACAKRARSPTFVSLHAGRDACQLPATEYLCCLVDKIHAFAPMSR